MERGHPSSRLLLRKERTSNLLTHGRPLGSSCGAGPLTPQPPALASTRWASRPEPSAPTRTTKWLPRELGLPPRCRGAGSSRTEANSVWGVQ